MSKARPQPSATISLRMYFLVVMAVRKDPETRGTLFPGVIADRGYTMHSLYRPFGKHLDDFKLINMLVRPQRSEGENGRIGIYPDYLGSPLPGRFLSPDNHIQAPGNPQNYNRYAYALNNPLKYTDPTGEFIWTAITGVADFIATAFFKGGLDPTSKNARRNAWRDFDPTAEWSQTNKAWKIDMGLFKTDENRNTEGRIFQLFSRFTWELPQTVLGNGYSHIRNISGNVDDISYYGGTTLVNKHENADNNGIIHRWGLTLGSYINSKNVVADPYTDDLFRHEYGHTLQSRLVGPLYLTHVGLPSLIGSGLDDLGLSDHRREWYETQASRMSKRYFNNHNPEALVALPWDENQYPREYNPNWY